MCKPQPAEDFEIASQPAPTRAGTRSLGWIALIVLTAGLSYGAGRRISTDSIAEAATDARLSMVPSVRTVTAHRLAGGVPLDLPGSLESFETATIFARASGHISQRSADIGTQVKKGDVLAIIRSPELDQQVSQAEATLTQSRDITDRKKEEMLTEQLRKELAHVTRVTTAGQLAAIGHRTGVAKIFGFTFSGFFARWLWRTIYLSKLPRFEKKVRVAMDWMLDLFFRKDFVQYLTPPPAHISVEEPRAESETRDMEGAGVR